MFTVIKLGGCNGSGKTSVARALLKQMQVLGTKHRGGKADAFYQGLGDLSHVYVLGRYENACGGMDTISDKEDRLALVKASCKPRRIVFFEGLITGKTYGAMGALSELHYKRKAGRWLYAFMDTPFDVCAARVLQRRQAAGNLAPFDPERTMRSTFNSCEHLLEKLRGERVGRTPVPQYHETISLDHGLKPETLAKRLLNKALAVQHAGF